METPTLHIPKESASLRQRIGTAFAAFSATDKVVFVSFIVIFTVSALYIIGRINAYFVVQVPISGGTLVEGIVGYPRFINPLLTTSDSGRDLTELVYSGLMRATPDGSLIPDLAEKYTISEDQLAYTFTLKNDITFQDGTPVTADDIVFTIEKTQDALIQSPKRANWVGVTVQKIDDKTVEFILQKPYAPFIENTTLGILPKHIWKNISNDQFNYSQFNDKPIGSGPYTFSKIQYDGAGMPQSYEFKSFADYALGQPYISTIIIRIYQNEDTMLNAFDRGEINSMYDISPAQAAAINKDGSHIELATLPRVFGVFFNQNQAPVLANTEVRQALEMTLDKESIIEKVLAGYALAIDTPIPPGLLLAASSSGMLSTTTSTTQVAATSTVTTGTRTTSIASTTANLAAAKKLLADKGWTVNETTKILEKKSKTTTQSLTFSISTPDAPELVQIAKMVQANWQELGAQVDIKISESGELNQNIIRPRHFDALLFGEIIGRDLDLYAFWHSSQRTDPGLNITGYVNLKVDKILETARTTTEMADRLTLYQKFEDEIRNDIPAIFIYSPQFTYVVPNTVHGINLNSVTVPAERFTDIYHWYIDTDSVWKIFVPKRE